MIDPISLTQLRQSRVYIEGSKEEATGEYQGRVKTIHISIHNNSHLNLQELTKPFTLQFQIAQNFYSNFYNVKNLRINLKMNMQTFLVFIIMTIN